MVLGLLTLAAIPTVTGVSQAIAQKDKKYTPKTAAYEERQMQRFHLRAWCEGHSRDKQDVHHGVVVASEGKLWVQPPTVPRSRCILPPLEGFYIEYPDPERIPAELGLVVQVASDPPLLNWVYIHESGRICHGNRTESRPFLVGNWGATCGFEGDDGEEGPGGLEFEAEEKFVAVKPHPWSENGMWEIWWDANDNKLSSISETQGRLVLRISLERELK